MPDRWRKLLDDAIDRRFEAMVAVRRQLHAHPEPSGEEFQTSLYLYQSLGDAGFSVEMGPEGRGVVADLPSPTTAKRTTSAEGNGNGAPHSTLPRIALRADIDALRIQEKGESSYRSRRDGVMHACGHDGHTAVVWGALCSLAELRQSEQLPWPLPLRGIFQPAEEIGAGAREMIDAGSLEGVGAILAAHVDPSRPVGRVGFRSGVFTANCDSMTVLVRGRGGHAARPHEAIDPIAAAAQFINAVYLSIPRLTDSQDAVVVTIGQVLGGHNANVIPDHVELRGTLRTLDGRVRQQTIEHVRRIAEGVGQACRTTIEVEFAQGTPSVENDPGLVELLRQSAAEVVSHEGLDAIPRPSMGSEDFAFYLHHAPGAMFRLGCASPKVGASGLHTPTFDLDEEALRIGARILARAAVAWCDPQRSHDSAPAARTWTI
ncbi:MAG: amidohydrolase [Planctomycetes bacterium]|nr:amidohydrolase [Planctomycetota bacterium]